MKTVTEIADQYVDDVAALDPVFASRALGLARDTTDLTDYSPEGHGARAAMWRRVIADLDTAEPADENERLGREYLRDLAAGRLALAESGDLSGLVSALSGPPAMVRMCFDVMAKESDDDWSRIAQRLLAVPDAMRGYRESLHATAEQGLVAGRRLVDEVADQAALWASGWFANFIGAYGDGPLRADLERGAAAAASSYGDLAAWLRTDLAPGATEVDGVGRERYRLWATSMLGVELDPDESYDWGVDELARLQAEQATEADRILPGASFTEVRHHLDADPAGIVEGVDAYRDALQGLLDEAVAALDGVEFDIAPELRRCVVGIPPGGTALAPYYSPPSEDLSQPGTTWFPSGGRDRFPMWGQHTTVYHEAVPGHHLQLGLTRMLPLVRAHRVGLQAAHAEGWALYAERLMDELGWFRTPATRLGFLSMQAFRAARVVVDIGLHTGRGGWTYERAVDAIEDAAGISRAFAESEVKRYLSWPGQATAYKLGERTWLAGRAAAMQAAGPAFDRKAWHSRALGLGALGLAALERELAGLTPA